MKDFYGRLQGFKPDILMFFAQIAFAAGNIIYKLAINDGMSMRIATAYRFICAAAFTIPIALIFDRNKSKITWSVLSKGFLCGLFGGSLYLNLYLEALALTSATFMLAVVNLIPAITFVIAVCLGMDKLNLRVAEGKGKVIGTIIGMGGAMTMIFFKGVEINLWSSNINLLHPHHNQNSHVASHHTDIRSKLLGVSLALTSSCSFSLWFITQAKLNVEYPSYHSSAALMATMGAIQSTIIALSFDKDWNQWKLTNNIRILTVIYPGIVMSGIVVMVIAWCIRIRGPVFVSIFNPLQLLLGVIAAYLILDEKLYLGSMLGAMLIVCGLYAVLWGQSNEMKMKAKLVSLNINGDFENVELVVISTPMHHDKCIQSQGSTTKNIIDNQ